MSKSHKYPKDNHIRIDTWRNTLQLFHKYNKVGFVGPFFASGYKHYRLDSGVNSEITGSELTPDIITWDKKRKKCAFVEISNDEKLKTDQVNSYKSADLSSLSVYGGPANLDPNPEIIVALDKPHNTSDYCQILVNGTLQLIHDDKITDDILKDNLRKTVDTEFNHLPEIKISLLPEMHGSEIRYGLSGFIMQIFAPGSTGYSAKELCDLGLGDFANLFSTSSRKKLKDKVTHWMNVLMDEYLTDYLEYVDGKYRAKPTERKQTYAASSQTRKLISEKIQAWLYHDTKPENTTDSQSRVDYFFDIGDEGN